MKNSHIQDTTLLQEYFVECEELLQGLDQSLIRLEAAPAGGELLNGIFRAFHSIKGTSGFLGFGHVVELTHAAEGLLSALRSGECNVSRPVIDALLAALDQLRKLIDGARNNSPAPCNLPLLLARLRDLAVSNRSNLALSSNSSRTERRPPGPRLGEILTENKIVSHTQFEATLAEAVQSGRRVGEVLVEKGLATESQVQAALEEQSGAATKFAPATIRVDVSKLAVLGKLVDDLARERDRLVQLGRSFAVRLVSRVDFEASIARSTRKIGALTDELQTTSQKMRMVPIDVIFRKFPRIVRDVALALCKEVELEVRGEAAEFDKSVAEQLGDPLLHLVRNALDHGIESPEVREGHGKPRRGRIILSAEQEADGLVVTVADDGAGIDPDRILRAAIERGILTPERAAALSRREILDLIFLPGFTTVEKVGKISGRGVGLDVVRTNITLLNGVTELKTEVGHGLTVLLKIPFAPENRVSR